MTTRPSPDEAAALLSQIDAARGAMRQAIRAHRGHYHLWIWGAAWIAMPLAAYFGGDAKARFFPLICLAGAILSALTGFTQSRQLRRPVNPRFVSMFGAIWVFGLLFPFVLRTPLEVRTLYAYLCLLAMQSYVVAGLWTDTYLLWVGLVVTLFVLIGLFFFPALFWLWMAIFGGGSLVLTGFYVRHFWR
jgi:hypothetical protein